MSSSIPLSAATRQNLLSLQDTASLLSTTQSRLSTGKKVNSALDNPTNFFTSQALTARSGDLSALLDGISNGIQTIQSANQGITSITKLLDTAKSTASQALADKTGGGGGVKGGVTSQAAKAGGTQALASVAGAATANGVTTFDLSSPTKDASLDISLDGGATKTTIRLDSTAFAAQGLDTTKVTTDQLVSNINAQIANSPALGGKVKAAVGDDGRLAFTTTATGASAKISVAGSGSATQDIGFGVAKTPPKAATATAANALPATTDFSNGASASLTVTDGGKTVTVTLDKDSLLADGVTKLAPDVTNGGTTTNTANQAKVVEAINRQLADKGSTATVELGTGADLNKLVFKSSDVGPDAQISVSGGADTTAGGIGFTTFTVGGGKPTAPTDLPASASTPGTGAGTPITTNGSAGAVTFGKSLGAAGASVPIATGLSTTFSVNGKSITIDATTPKAAPVGNNPAATLGATPTREDIAAAINLQLNPTGQPAATVTAGFDATTNALTFTDSNRANAAPTVVTSGGTNTDTIGLFSTPSTVSYTAAMPATFNFSGSKSASFTVGATNITLNSSSALTSGTLGSGGGATRDEVVDAINTQLKSANSNITASLSTTNILTFVEGDGSTSTGLAIAGATDNAFAGGGTAFFTTANTAGPNGTTAAQTSTPSVRTSTTVANSAAALSTASFGTGGQTTFTVGSTEVTLNADSLDGNGAKLGLAPTTTNLLGAINKQLTDGNAGVQATMPNGKLVFSNTTASTTPPTVTTSGAGLTDQLGLFGTPAKTTLTTDLSTRLTSGKLDLSSGAAAFTIGGTSVTLSKDATDGLGGAGKLGANPTLAAVVTSLNDQLKTTGYSASIDNNNRLTFVGPNSGTTPPALTNVSDSVGLGFGTAATATAPAAAQTIAVGAPNAGKVDLSDGKSSSFKIGDGANTASVTINANSVIKDGTTKLGTAATTDQIREAIQYQLDTNAGGAVKATVSFDNTGALKASSNAIGASATVTLAGLSDTAKLGLGSTTPANGTFTAGTGAPADAVVSSGTDATDGSSVALVKANTAVSSGVALAASANASFELTLGSGSTTTINLIGSAKTATAAGLVGEIQKAIDNDTGLNGKVKVSLGSDNKLAFSTLASGADQKLTIKAAGTADIGLGLNTAGVLKGSGTDKGGSLGTSSVRTTLASQFNNLLTQITQQAKDSSYNGVNLLFRNGSNASENTLHVSFNEKNTSALDIQGVKFDAEGLGLTATTGNFQTDEEINAVIDKLNSATTTLRTQSSTFGANLSVVQNRQDFTKNLSNILDTGAANLTNADLNEEAANSQALSTRNSLAISALSLANQSQQGILQLLR